MMVSDKPIEIGRIGLWTSHAMWGNGTDQAAEAAIAIESAGYGALWIGGASDNHQVFQPLLDATSSLVLASGIISIWRDDPTTSAALHHSLDAAHPGRFLLGIGSSHGPLVEAGGQTYERPYSKLVEYLDQLDNIGSVPSGQRVLAALGPRTLRLAAERSLGAHPYLVTPEHTAFARTEIGADAVLAPEQGAVLNTDPSEARAIARQALAHYLELPNYTDNWLRFGFTPDDLVDGGSNRLVDALIVWGDEFTIAERVKAHHDAGADHVSLQILTSAGHNVTAPEVVGSWQRVGQAVAG